MNYKEGLNTIREMNVAGGAGGMFGSGDIGTFGGAVGNSDFYAPGDARVPKILGLGSTKAPGKKGKKGKKSKIPFYRRAFVETLTTESTNDEYILLSCTLHTEVSDYKQIICDLLEKLKTPYTSEENDVIIEGSDRYIQSVLEKIQNIVTVDPFENGDIIALIGESEEVSANKIPGGKSQGKTIEDFYHKYDSKGYYDIKNFEMEFNKALQKGIKVEMEHTKDKEIAREIAADHLWEDLYYYTKLAKMENK